MQNQQVSKDTLLNYIANLQLNKANKGRKVLSKKQLPNAKRMKTTMEIQAAAISCRVNKIAIL